PRRCSSSLTRSPSPRRPGRGSSAEDFCSFSWWRRKKPLFGQVILCGAASARSRPAPEHRPRRLGQQNTAFGRKVMAGIGANGDGRSSKLTRKTYEKELRKLQIDLCRLQDWVKHKGLRVIIVFEGRDAAGKGGTIKAITGRVSPRVFRVVALPAPSD